MPKIMIDSEKIAKIKNALTIINFATEDKFCYPVNAEADLVVIKEQVKRIDKLLSIIKFEKPK